MEKTNNKFQLVSPYKPTGDQPEAIKELIQGINDNKKFQVLLGATGTGKTFTMANVIYAVQKPTLILVHNKTLAGQLYAEFKELFPNNRVEYFVSNFDFYQPEAYIPSSDLYIDKNAVMNEEIELLRTSAINSVMSRNDVIVVGSVASIYGLSDPDEYNRLIFEIRIGEKLNRSQLFGKLIESLYKRNNIELGPGEFRVHGDVIEIMSANDSNTYVRIDTFDDEVETIKLCDFTTGEVVQSFVSYPIFPAYDHASTHERIKDACSSILKELDERHNYFIKEGKLLEAERIDMRTRQDVDSLREFGMCPGIENYSAHIDKRKPGQRPFCLIDYFPKDFLMFIDESHATIPQINGMYNGDRSRKTTLVEYGFRLPSALDNRPLKFVEFESLIHQVIFTSATPGDYELGKVEGKVSEQIIRPTGLLDPIIEVRKTLGQIDDIIFELRQRTEKQERVMIVTLTIKMAEKLTKFLQDKGFKVAYLHSETKTLERTRIIYDFRKGKYDCLVGINLLREGLDIPEVSLICILDADKEGFLRSTRSLIQTSGRAARNVNGKVIMYADTITDSMKECIDETNRRRSIQDNFNKLNGIIPTTIVKPIREPITSLNKENGFTKKGILKSKKQIDMQISELKKEMKKAADSFDFERAIEIRDAIFELQEDK